MGPPSRCLYETLGISRIATDGEIKKAYRTLALERHPDKNPNNKVNAEEEFKELQHAYNVLSDPHERSWYDGHRDEILRGWDGNTEEKDTSGKRGRTANASDVEIYAYFTSSAYDGYTGAQGFYSVFGDVFDRLAREDDNAAEINPECDDEKTHPPFGGADADWSTVRDFYSVWEGFSSRQTFAWADKWKVADVSRVYRREMERENRRERVKERKKFNALVRELVAFVKKRDLRVLNRRKEEERLREQEEERREAQRKNEQKERERNLEHIRAIRDQALEEDAEELDNILASIALDERIERHQRKKQECQNNNDSREEDVECNSGDEVIEEKVNDDENSDEGPPESEEKTISDGDEEIADLNSQLAASSTESDQSQMPEELYCAACRKPMRTVGQMKDHIRSKKHKAAEKRLQKEVLAEEAEFFAASNPIKEADDVGDDGSEKHLTDGDNKADDSNMHGRKRKNKKRNRLKNIQSNTVEHELDEGTDMETGPERGDTAALRGIGAKRDVKRGDDSRLDRNGNEIDKASVEDDVGKTGAGVERVLSKREKRKLREQRKREADNSESTWKCNRCGASFESRTKLMRHVNALGHGLHVDSKQQK